MIKTTSPFDAVSSINLLVNILTDLTDRVGMLSLHYSLGLLCVQLNINTGRNQRKLQWGRQWS